MSRRSEHIQKRVEKARELHGRTLDDLELIRDAPKVRAIINDSEKDDARRLRKLARERQRMKRIRQSVHKDQMRFERACFTETPSMHAQIMNEGMDIARSLGWRRKPSQTLTRTLKQAALNVGRDRMLLICYELIDTIRRQWTRELKTILFGDLVQELDKGVTP